MSQFFAYIAIQWKRYAKVLLRSICILGGTVLVISLILFCAVKILDSGDGIKLVKVGVVIPEDELAGKYAVSYISSMDSVKSICEFVYLDKEEALREYKNGTLQAAVVLPEGFYHDVQVGLNPPAVVYFPENPGLAGSIFRDLLISGVSYLQIAEAGVYATLDLSYVYETGQSTADIGNNVALSYVNEIFARDKMFEEKTVSALGGLSVSSYYMIAGMVFFLMMSGVTFYFLYDRNSRAVEDKLRINGMNRLSCALTKVIVMIPAVYVSGLVLYYLVILVFNRLMIEEIETDSHIFIMMGLLSLTLSVYFALIYSAAGSGKAGIFVLIMINIIGASISGMIIPGAYLSEWTQQVSRFLPMRYWMRMLCIGIYGSVGGI